MITIPHEMKAKKLCLLFCLLALLALSWAARAELFRLQAAIAACVARYGVAAGPQVQYWHDVLTTFQSSPETTKLRDVNEFFNRRLRWDTDQNIWRMNDYWATPVESLLRAMGDCEDFAIAKYYSLKYLGVSTQKLRITYVKAQLGGAGSALSQAHMVLAYYESPTAEPLILDNLVGEMRPASRRPDLTPIFSFNSEGVWTAGGVQQGGGITLWNDLRAKISAEGFEP
jgi:predicted transglutaminase-like cysteine proteinase